MERLLARYRLPQNADPAAIARAIAARTTPRPSASDRRELGVPVAGAVEVAVRGEVQVSYRLPTRLRADDVLTLAAWDLPPGVILEHLALPAECADRLPRAAMGASGIRERLRLAPGRPLIFMTPSPWPADSLLHLRDSPDLVRHLYYPTDGYHAIHHEVVQRSIAIEEILRQPARAFLKLADLNSYSAEEAKHGDFTDRDGREARLVKNAAALKERGFDGMVVPLALVGFDVAPQLAEAIGGPVLFEVPPDHERPWFVDESRTDRHAGVRRFTRAVVFATAARLAGADGIVFTAPVVSGPDERGVLSRADLLDVVSAASEPLAGLPPLLVVLAAGAPAAVASLRANRDHVALTAAAGIASSAALRRACAG